MAQEISDVGCLLIPGHGVISISQWLEDGIYDTLTIADATAITAGTEYEFYTTLTNKNKDATNMVEINKLPEGWEIIIMKMGIEFCPTCSMIDITNMANRSYIRFETGNSKIRRRGPTYLWPICFGKYTMTSRDEAAAATYAGQLQVGGQAFSGAPILLIPIRISPRLNFKTTLTVTEAFTTESAFRMRFWLYGYISRPV